MTVAERAGRLLAQADTILAPDCPFGAAVSDVRRANARATARGLIAELGVLLQDHAWRGVADAQWLDLTDRADQLSSLLDSRCTAQVD